MKRIFLSLLLALCVASGYAVVFPVTHNFNTLNGTPGNITYSNSSKTATINTTDLHLVYTCYNSGVFGIDCLYSSLLALNLPNRNDSVIITPAISDLKGFRVQYYSTNSSYDSFRFYISEDGESWTLLSGDEVEMGVNTITASFDRGSWQVKIINKSSKASVSLTQITYETEPCPNCFQYESGE